MPSSPRRQSSRPHTSSPVYSPPRLEDDRGCVVASKAAVPSDRRHGVVLRQRDHQRTVAAYPGPSGYEARSLPAPCTRPDSQSRRQPIVGDTIVDVMVHRPHRARHRLPAARALLLLSALVGLFAMHGLSDHGASHLDLHTTGEAGLWSVSGGQHTMGQSHGSAAGSGVGTVAPGAQDEKSTGDTGLPGGLGVVVGLCLAVIGLVGLAVSLVALRRRQRDAHSLDAVRGVPCPGSSLRIRTTDPPDRYRLQVHRC